MARKPGRGGGGGGNRPAKQKFDGQSIKGKYHGYKPKAKPKMGKLPGEYVLEGIKKLAKKLKKK